MLDVLSHRTYRHLFLAQVIALLGTGLATVALGLLAYDLAGADAGKVLGTALAIKMVAYVAVAPVVGAYANRLPRRALLVTMDLTRALIALSLPFVDEIWQIYVLIFVLQSASAAFTPTFQATIPDVLQDEKDYTRALSLSRLAYDLESLASPALAAALLTVISFHWLFGGTSIGFFISAALVMSVKIPTPKAIKRTSGILKNIFHGASIYVRTPRLRGLLALNIAASSAGSMVFVNTVVYVQSTLQKPSSSVPIALAAFGIGSMLVALLLPKLLENRPDRPAMLTGAVILALVLFLGSTIPSLGDNVEWFALLAIWFALGLGYSLTLTPSGRLLKRSSTSDDRPALFAAQFSLSHVCWLITYPLAGSIGAAFGMRAAFLALGFITITGTVAAWLTWPKEDADVLAHEHDSESVGDHLGEGELLGGLRHSHHFTIDDQHPTWPRADRGG